MRRRIPWVQIVASVVALAGGAGTAAVASGAAGDPNSPAVELHLDTLQNTHVSGNGTTPVGTTPDSSGNNLNGIAEGTLTSDARFGQALDMSYPGDSINVTDNPLLRPARVTVMAWVRHNGNPGFADAIVAKPLYPNACHDPSYGLSAGATGVRFTAVTDDNAQHTSPESDNTVWDGHWHAIAGTYDGSALKLYVDGALVGSTAIGAHAIVYTTDQPDLQYSGLYAGQPPTNPNNFGCDWSSQKYSGAIDEARVYGRALSDSEIATLQSAGATSPPELPPANTSSSTTTTSQSATTSQTTPTRPPIITTAPTLRLTTSLAPGGKGLILNASASKGAQKLLWDLNGNGIPDFQGGPSATVVKLTEPQRTALPIRLTGIGAGGASSTIITHVVVPGQGVSPTRMSQVVAVGSFLDVFKVVNTLNNCSQMDVITQLTDARGCFSRIDSADQIPFAEKKTVLNYYDNAVLPGYVIAMCQLAKREPKAKPFCDSWTAEWKNLDMYVSDREVKLNGTTVTPAAGAAVVVYPSQKRVICSRCTVRVGPFVLKKNKAIDFDFTNVTVHVTGSRPGRGDGNGDTNTIFTFNPAKDVPLIGGFPLDGGAEIRFGADYGVYKTKITLHVTLPPTFDAFGSGTQPSAATTVSASNDRDLFLDTLDISVPHASLGGIGFDNVAFHYADGGDALVGCPSKYWHATGNITFGQGVGGQPAGGFYLTPPPKENGIAFCDGDFKAVGIHVPFNPPLPKPELFPGLFLDSIDGALSLNPTLIRAGFRVSAGDLYYVDGVGLIAFARPWQLYHLTTADEGPALRGLGPRTFTSTSLAAGGAVGFHVGGQDLSLGGIGGMYSFPDYIAIGGYVDIYLGVFRAYGSISGDANLRTRDFQLTVEGHACVSAIADGLCLGGQAILSSQGIMGCVDFGGDLHGIGVHPPGSSSARKYGLVELWVFKGCRPSHFWVTVPGRSSAAGHATAGLTFHLARGETVKNLALAGIGGAPKILVTGPGGARFVLDGNSWTRQGPFLGVRGDRYTTTWFGISHGRPGTYTITPLPGSVPFGTLRATRPGYDTNFSARVTGTGNRRVLHYDARKRGGGQQVTFWERGQNVFHRIAISSGGRGTARFTPAPGARGLREIVAGANVDGSPIQPQVVSHYFFSGTPRTGRPGRVTVHRRGSALVINWTAAAGAIRYGVLVRRTGGSQQRYVLSPRRRSLRVARFPATEGARVTVSIEGPLGDWGRARAGNFVKAQKPSFSVFLSPRRRPGKHR